jgi:hemerythrin-like metal-binding protein
MLQMIDDLRIGHPIIDMDHQRLFDIINDFNRHSTSLSNERMMHQTLKALHKYGEEHFLREQKIQLEFRGTERHPVLSPVFLTVPLSA